MSTNVLAARDVNTSAPGTQAHEQSSDEKIKSLEYHRQVLQSRMESGEANKQYVSPSDNIMSPTTAKLSAMRNKRLMNNSKPKSLFAKTSSKNALASGLGEDIAPMKSAAATAATTEEEQKPGSEL